jgi:hypothetical protein
MSDSNGEFKSEKTFSNDLSSLTRGASRSGSVEVEGSW